ncbi:MAG TPA: zinc ribbon domain-containing protein [Solirubrobacteraceae bacterium]|jgi:putative FmdB family regulatory protein|nr:zinc ribbon domain-containing protein [Solirubrobacteraceae bacterium]
MPLYEYRCTGCGPFELHRELALAAADAACPGCGAPAARMFSAPGGRVPRRQRQLEGLSGPGRGRLDRAQTGAPATGTLPAGVRLDGSGKPRARPSSRADERRPWQLGH